MGQLRKQLFFETGNMIGEWDCILGCVKMKKNYFVFTIKKSIYAKLVYKRLI